MSFSPDERPDLSQLASKTGQAGSNSHARTHAHTQTTCLQAHYAEKSRCFPHSLQVHALSLSHQAMTTFSKCHPINCPVMNLIFVIRGHVQATDPVAK